MSAYPDLDWYSKISSSLGLGTRCPFATVHRCPRYYQSASLLAREGITASLNEEKDDDLLKKWEESDIWPVFREEFTSVSGGEQPNLFDNFCPEVAFNTFHLFASVLIRFSDDLDLEARTRQLKSERAAHVKDWRWRWQYVEPLHFSHCPMFPLLSREKSVPEVNFSGLITGQVNVAGGAITSPVLYLSLAELEKRIEQSDASSEEKQAARSILKEFLAHPVVAAIIGGLSGGIVS